MPPIFRPLLITIILLFTLARANSGSMDLEEFYNKFISSDSFSEAKKDLDFFVSHFHKEAKIFISDYRVILNCHENYKPGNSKNIPTDRCFKGEIFLKAEFQIIPLNEESSKRKYDVGYISGVIDFKDPLGKKEILLIEASFYGPLTNKPVLITK